MNQDNETKYEPMMKQYAVSGIGKGCGTALTTDDGYKLHTDTPLNHGGNGQYAQPIQSFLSSLVGCEQATAMYIAKQLGFTIDSIDFDVKAERDEIGARYLPIDAEAPVVSRLTRIWGTAKVSTAGSKEQVEQLEKIVKIRCPVANMVVLSGCKLEIEWVKKGV